MAIRSLDALSALSTGCELWFVADLNSSRWTRKIDWYLNFQLAAAEVKPSVEISSDLSRVAKLWDYEIPQITIRKTMPLLVASARLLPNTKTVLVPYADAENALDGQSESQGAPSAQARARAAKAWIERCHEVWLGLEQPAVRIFLPDVLKPEVVEKFWPDTSGTEVSSPVIDVVADVETLPVER